MRTDAAGDGEHGCADTPAEATAGFERDQERLRALAANALTSDEVCSLLGVERQALEERALFAVRGGGELRYPRWQFDPVRPGGVVPGLLELRAAFAISRLGPVEQALWLETPQPFFDGERAADWLRRGDWEAVVELARGAGWR